jgi:hypothetical protein
MTTNSGNGSQISGIFLVLGLLGAAILITIFYTQFIPSLRHMPSVSSGYDYLIN